MFQDPMSSSSFMNIQTLLSVYPRKETDELVCLLIKQLIYYRYSVTRKAHRLPAERKHSQEIDCIVFNTHIDNTSRSHLKIHSKDSWYLAQLTGNGNRSSNLSLYSRFLSQDELRQDAVLRDVRSRHDYHVSGQFGSSRMTAE